MSALDDPHELDHYKTILISFQEYVNTLSHELFERRNRLKGLPDAHYKRLSSTNLLLTDFNLFVKAIKSNQQFLLLVMHETYRNGPQFKLPPISPKSRTSTSYHHFSKIKSTLHQCVRDWSIEGKEERDECYTPLLNELERVLPVTEKGALRVLLPGAGLGRLLLEIASRGNLRSNISRKK